MNRPPFGLARHWKEWIGSVKAEKLEKANLFLMSKGSSTNPEVLDGENDRYKARVYQFYRGILLTGFFGCYYAPHVLTGANVDGEITVRQIAELPLPHILPGAPVVNIDKTRLLNAANLADAIEDLPAVTKRERLGRVLHAFNVGIESDNPANRLHQFVRCIEGFIYPDIGATKKQFRSRTELFLGPRHHRLTGELYDIRCFVEHLHDPLREVGGATEREKRLRLLQHAMESEAIARYCICSFLSNRTLWPYFENDQNLAGFWKLSDHDRRKLWGVPLDIDAVSKSFDPQFVSDSDLGL
jgi:hypothetical protein